MPTKYYFDNAATTPVREEVLQEILPYFREYYGNASSIYSIAKESKKALEAARAKVAAAIGATPDEIYFTAGGSESDNMALRGVVSAKENVQATARLYDYMMLDNPEDPNGEMIMNPNSLEVKECFIEPSVKDAKKGDRFQFMRNGYYIVDTKDTTEEHLVFNRIVPLKSSFKLK